MSEVEADLESLCSELREELVVLQDRCDGLRAALNEIVDSYGQVYSTYEVCEHESCQSSYGAWAAANAALSRY